MIVPDGQIRSRRYCFAASDGRDLGSGKYFVCSSPQTALSLFDEDERSCEIAELIGEICGCDDSTHGAIWSANEDISATEYFFDLFEQILIVIDNPRG